MSYYINKEVLPRQSATQLTLSKNEIDQRNFSNGDRRQFILRTAAMAAGAIAFEFLGAGKSTISANESESAQAVTLVGSTNLDLMRVHIEMDVKGNVDVPDNPLISRDSSKKLPIHSESLFDYEERYRRSPGAAGQTNILGVERFYHEAKSTSKLNRNQKQAKLRESVRQAVVRRDLMPEVVYAVDDYFLRDELDLLRLPVSSCNVDDLLPSTAVRPGDKYAINPDVLSSLLNLTSVDASDVEAEVASIESDTAKIQFRGKVDGSVDGVPTVLRLLGKLTLDRRIGTCTWLAMAIHETREIGNAEPGFDVAATIKMIRKPLDQPVALPPSPEPIALSQPVSQDRLFVQQSSRQLGVSMLVDRRWRLLSDVPGSAMLRMIENDRSIAQCDLRPLATLKAGQQWTLEAFQQDVRQSLGKSLGELIEADQRLGESGLRVMRVTAQGTVQGVPIQWIMMHFSDDSGRRVLATFTMDGKSVDDFAGSDIQLASTLRFLTEAEQKSQVDGITRWTPVESEADIATMPPVSLDDELQSMSDLR